MIDKEIKIIKSRDYLNIQNLQKEVNKIKESNINWVSYNSNYFVIRSSHNQKLILMISISIGLILSIFFVLIKIWHKSNFASKESKRD